MHVKEKATEETQNFPNNSAAISKPVSSLLQSFHPNMNLTPSTTQKKYLSKEYIDTRNSDSHRHHCGLHSHPMPTPPPLTAKKLEMLVNYSGYWIITHHSQNLDQILFLLFCLITPSVTPLTFDFPIFYW
ncbi:unnamed protein product [Prunus armeniaca]